jgi:hypothetical protein
MAFLTSTQGFTFKLIANGVDLDIFKDEEIKISNNITQLFDLGAIPADFTRTITLPGTKTNNAFFEHYYDISVYSPLTFGSNNKVPAYLDFDGIYVANGYLQLNKVNVFQNKYIDSYEVTLYGATSAFSRDTNKAFLTDLTSLRSYNHTASLANINLSWSGSLFGGDIIYPLADYGQALSFNSQERIPMSVESGSLTVQDFKPAIRIKKVWDAIFDTYGYTYTSSFWNQPFLDNVYMVLNNDLSFIQTSGSFFGSASVDLQNYGQFKIGPISGSVGTNVSASHNTSVPLNWNNFQKTTPLLTTGSVAPIYSVERPTKLNGTINLQWLSTKDKVAAGIGVPQFTLQLVDANNTASKYETPLDVINDYMVDVYFTLTTTPVSQSYEAAQTFTTLSIPSGSYYPAIKQTVFGVDNFDVRYSTAQNPVSYLEINKVKQAGDYKIIDIPSNMPFGQVGIRLVDFIKAVQKKFNLVFYPNNTKNGQFICETFDDWYKRGSVKDFNKYINLNEKIEVIPANNLAVNKLTFGDTLDGDYISQQFSKENSRPYGDAFYVDTTNYFSQGEFKVESGFASTPLGYIDGTGQSGSATFITINSISVSDADAGNTTVNCLGTDYTQTNRTTTATLLDSFGNATTNIGPTLRTLVRYDVQPCYGSSFVSEVYINIPFGASTGTYNYASYTIVDCGQSNCVPETAAIQCVVSVSGQSGISLNVSSPITAC